MSVAEAKYTLMQFAAKNGADQKPAAPLVLVMPQKLPRPVAKRPAARPVLLLAAR